MAIDRTWRAVFDTTAELYAQARPSYPAALVDNVLQLSAIPAEGRILEIGCGPGNAALLFAQRGHHLLAVELGKRLAALAAARCRDYPRVSVRQYILFPVQLLSLYGVTMDTVGQWPVCCFGQL